MNEKRREKMPEKIIDPVVMNHLIGAMQYEIDTPKDLPYNLKQERLSRALQDIRGEVPVNLAQVIATPSAQPNVGGGAQGQHLAETLA
jgi:hypothetical protein